MTTSRTGQRARTDDVRAGTSLIELILVLAILATISAIVAPRLGGFTEGRQFVGEWNRLNAFIRYARSEAIARGVPVELRFDEEKKSYHIADDVYGFRKTQGSATEHVLPKKLAFEFPEDSERGDGGIAIVFLPDGNADEESPKSLSLVEPDGEFERTLSEDPVLGYVVSEAENDERETPSEPEE